MTGPVPPSRARVWAQTCACCRGPGIRGAAALVAPPCGPGGFGSRGPGRLGAPEASAHLLEPLRGPAQVHPRPVLSGVGGPQGTRFLLLPPPGHNYQPQLLSLGKQDPEEEAAPGNKLPQSKAEPKRKSTNESVCHPRKLFRYREEAPPTYRGDAQATQDHRRVTGPRRGAGSDSPCTSGDGGW